MDSTKTISDLENLIAEKICIRVEKWNLYLGDAGLARNLAIECLSHLDKGSKESVFIATNTIKVKFGDGKEEIPLCKLIISKQLEELEYILDDFI